MTRRLNYKDSILSTVNVVTSFGLYLVRVKETSPHEIGDVLNVLSEDQRYNVPRLGVILQVIITHANVNSGYYEGNIHNRGDNGDS